MTLVAAPQKLIKFDTKTFLSTINGGRTITTVAKKQTIFAQGDSSNAVFYIREGKVKLTVLSKSGKEATIGILNEGDFFREEGCLTGQPLPPVLRNRDDRLLGDANRQEIDGRSASPGTFVLRHVRDLFADPKHPSTKRIWLTSFSIPVRRDLARILLLLAQFGKEGVPETLIANINQQTLAEMVGTTRSRVSFFMNRFRKLGFIDYHGGDDLQVHSSLLNIVLHD